MNRREASKRQTRSLIMEAAKKMFLETDLDKCTMRAIAKNAGVSPASVVVHFKNKCALMEAVLSEDIERAVERAVASMPQEGDFAERIAHIWRCMFTFYAGNRDLYRFFISRTVFESDEETPSIASEMSDFLNYVVGLIECEKQEGRLAPEVDSGVMAQMLFMEYFGVLVMFFRDASMTPEVAAEAVLAMIRQTLSGLTRRQTP
ncbi:transcriptional regulator, TetR family [Desulfatibacillum alkenivorans DSM 16219]|uniref:Transcriptional regulator, TetR family n=1 Tax=Desulfatibacillum alkenivorans DSM 16219 TaxID=1121393 RepID=A0A1M6KTR0_9BACT|nr:TetR/AcrR family transcriptional regulator [Desulfatibacillum alkenivorans]SHJ62250.1 transcriptional regulator, TetR family [Desulfatibacillum alkenivorans DSM 16219]